MPYHNPDKPEDDHSCGGKAREIQRRTNIILGLESHSIVSEMCRLWGTANADEFYQRMNGMGDDELKAVVEEARKNLRRKKGLLIEEKVAEYAYA